MFTIQIVFSHIVMRGSWHSKRGRISGYSPTCLKGSFLFPKLFMPLGISLRRMPKEQCLVKKTFVYNVFRPYLIITFISSQN